MPELNSWLRFKERSLPEILEHIAKLLIAQEDDVKKAFVQERGKYSDWPAFQKELQNSNFFKLNVKQRGAFFKRIANITMIDLHGAGNAPPSTARIDTSQANYLSVNYNEANVRVSPYTRKKCG